MGSVASFAGMTTHLCRLQLLEGIAEVGFSHSDTGLTGTKSKKKNKKDRPPIRFGEQSGPTGSVD